MVTVIRSLADTYKEENKRLKLKCEIYGEYIDLLEKRKAELEEENNAYRILLKKQLEEDK